MDNGHARRPSGGGPFARSPLEEVLTASGGSARERRAGARVGRAASFSAAQRVVARARPGDIGQDGGRR
eukprot:4087214-Lingulodinium_polyedra.AAC.1